MRRPRSLLGLFLAVLGLAVAAPSALALAPATADCLKHDGRLTRHYTVQQLESALHSIPAVDQEYGQCASILQQQIDVELAGTHVKRSSVGSGGGGSSGTTILIAVVIVVALAGGGLAIVAARRRQA